MHVKVRDVFPVIADHKTPPSASITMLNEQKKCALLELPAHF
jgi:hypothetical protein